MAARSSQDDELILFIDRDTWSVVLDEALKAASVAFVAHRDLFVPETPDAQWIGEVGRRGYIAITRDKNIRRRPNELAAVRSAPLLLFALTSGTLSARETADILLSALPSVYRNARSTLPPAMFSIDRAGNVRMLKH